MGGKTANTEVLPRICKKERVVVLPAKNLPWQPRIDYIFCITDPNNKWSEYYNKRYFKDQIDKVLFTDRYTHGKTFVLDFCVL